MGSGGINYNQLRKGTVMCSRRDLTGGPSPFTGACLIPSPGWSWAQGQEVPTGGILAHSLAR